MEDERNILHGPPSTFPLEDGTAGNYIFKNLKKYVNLGCCTTEPETGQSISYKQLLMTTCRLAESFKNNGFLPGTVISVCSENNVNYMVPIIAAFYIGIAVAPVNPNYTDRELAHIFNISRPTIVFCSQKELPKLRIIKSKLPYIKKIVIFDSTSTSNEEESFNDFINSGCPHNIHVELFKTATFNRDEQIAFILCSSGTTGLPKGVMITHRNIMVRFMQNRNTQFSTAGFVEQGGCIVNFMPLFHNFGLLVTLAYITMGLHIVQMKRFEYKLFLESIEKFKAQSILVVPPIMTLLVKSELVDKYDLSSLKEIGCGAAPLSKSIFEQIKERFNINYVRQGYGLTELTFLVCISRYDDIKQGSVGKLLPHTSLKVIDLDTQKNLGPNEMGEICLKGGTLMKGYMRNEEATRSAIDENGWFYTGDVGYYDENGHVYIQDRHKELIKYKGYQVAPAELEALLLEHVDIKEAAVVGKPDHVAGELPTAFVVVEPGKTLSEEKIHEFLDGKISHEKRLRGGVQFLDAIPRNSTGKILRRNLRDMLRNESKL